MKVFLIAAVALVLALNISGAITIPDGGDYYKLLILIIIIIFTLYGEDGEDGEDGNDYTLGFQKNDGKSLDDATNSKEYNSAKRVFLKYIKLNKRNVPMAREQEIKKKFKKDFELPKKCRRPDVCYIMKLCIYCKPFFKKQLKLKNG